MQRHDLQYCVGRLVGINQIAQGDAAQIGKDVIVQTGPQIMREALVAALTAVGLPGALGRVDQLIHRDDDVSDCDFRDGAGQPVAATRPTRAFHQAASAHAPEELLEVGERNALALADLVQSNRSLLAVHRQVEDGRDSESALCRESHELLREGATGTGTGPLGGRRWGSRRIPTKLVKNTIPD